MNIDCSESSGGGSGLGAESHELPARIQTGSRWKTAIAVGAVLASYFLIVWFWQWLSNANLAAFNGYPDEASHYVSGLLVRDYAVNGFPQSPYHYAVDYYAHVPFFAIGYWPPLFYAAEGVWMLLFGFDRAAVMHFVALITAASATLIFICTREQLGALSAFGTGLLFLFAPVVLWGSRMVMTDLSVTLLSFAAVVSFAQYLDSGKIKWNIAFALLSVATILTKSSGAFLAVVPLAGIAVSGRWRLARKLSFWIAPLIVVVLCGPWFVLAQPFLTKGFDGHVKPDLATTAAQLARGIFRNLLWLTPVVLYGAWTVLRRSRPLPGLAAVCLIQPLALLGFQAIAPVDNEPRYLTALLPPILILGAYGIRGIAECFGSRRALARKLLVMLLVGSFVARAATDLRPVPKSPLRSIAEFAISGPYRSVMVPADIEGPVIAEICSLTRDHQARFLVRPSKVLAQKSWLGVVSRINYGTKEEMQHFFDEVPFGLIVVRMDLYPEIPKYAALLREMVLAFPERWHHVSSFHRSSCSARYEAYAPVNSARFSPDVLRNVLPHPLGDRDSPPR